MRALWYLCGLLALGLAVVGIALPLLPTVPFLLLAAACFARSSPTLHDWLLAHPRFGPPIRDWREAGAIGPRAKRAAALSLLFVLAISVALGAPGMVIAIQSVVLAAVGLFIWTRPNC